MLYDILILYTKLWCCLWQYMLHSKPALLCLFTFSQMYCVLLCLFVAWEVCVRNRAIKPHLSVLAENSKKCDRLRPPCCSISIREIPHPFLLLRIAHSVMLPVSLVLLSFSFALSQFFRQVASSPWRQLWCDTEGNTRRWQFLVSETKKSKKEEEEEEEEEEGINRLL